MERRLWRLFVVLYLTAVTSAHGFKYIGCYIDHGGDRDLPDRVDKGDVFAVRCNNICAGKGYMFFGLQNSDECWCGNGYGKHGVAPGSQCNKQCKGDKSATCGSKDKNSVYASDFGASGIRYVGCFLDAPDRDLPQLAGKDAMSINRCQKLCKDKHFAYFGLQNGTECWCGNDYGKHGAQPEKDCNKRCSGDRDSLCGSDWRNNVYATGNSLLLLPGASEPIRAVVKAHLTALVKSQQISFPGGVFCDRCLMAAWGRREAEVRSRVFAVKDIASVVSSYPASVQEKLKNLQLGANAQTNFENYELTIAGNYVVRSSYIGAASRVSDTIELGIINAELVAYLIPKHHVFKKQSCVKIWFWTKCTIDSIRERIGYQPNEIDSIEQALRFETLKLFAEKLA